MVVVPHMDQQLHPHLSIPSLNDTFHIGVITSPTYYKGLDLMEKLFQETRVHNRKKVQFFLNSQYDNARYPDVFVRGGYDENDVYGKLDNDGIHGLLFLNRFPETYSYALTKGINSGRPLLYTNMGAVTERLVKENDTKYIATDNADVLERFGLLLDYIEMHEGQMRRNNSAVLLKLSELPVVVPTFYNHLFLNSLMADTYEYGTYG
jgi:hypothetical protein